MSCSQIASDTAALSTVISPSPPGTKTANKLFHSLLADQALLDYFGFLSQNAHFSLTVAIYVRTYICTDMYVRTYTHTSVHMYVHQYCMQHMWQKCTYVCTYEVCTVCLPTYLVKTTTWTGHEVRMYVHTVHTIGVYSTVTLSVPPTLHYNIMNRNDTAVPQCNTYTYTL